MDKDDHNVFYTNSDLQTITEGNIQASDNMLKLLTKVEMELAQSSEKLINLHLLLINLFALDNDLELMVSESTDLSTVLVEKAFVHDLLSGILDSELQELESYASYIQAEIADIGNKLSSYRSSMQFFNTMEEKLCDSEASFRNCQEHVLEVKRQLTKLQRDLFVRLENRIDENKKAAKLTACDQAAKMDAKSKWQITGRKKQVMRMLEKSLARELRHEKELSKLRQNEEQLRLKLHYTEQVAFHMEEASEVVWGRFLEAENAAEVLMGTSRELASRLMILQFSLNGSLQRESKLNSHLEDCLRETEAKDISLTKLNSSIAEHIMKSSEMPILKEKLKSLEEQLRRCEFQLVDSNALNEENQEQLSELENIVESLKESLYEAENRAETAEAKTTQLTDTKTELTDEISFLKENGENTAKKITILEKQLRDTEIQLQHAKASNEAGQEQQNMLYSAIWDMETLIEDLKSKVARADSKTEHVEEQCITLTETNMELNEELKFLRDRVNGLETSLKQAQNSKDDSTKEIELRTAIVMDLVMQLSKERERIKNQVLSLERENRMLVQKLQNDKADASVNVCTNRDCKAERAPKSENKSSNDVFGEALEEATISSNNYQNLEDNVTTDATSSVTAMYNSQPTGEITEIVSTQAAVATRAAETGNLRLASVAKGTVVVIIATLMYVLHKKPVLLDK